jgi:hypothetical protein
MRTVADLAREAVEIQDGCSMLGLSKGFARAVQELKDALDAEGQYEGTDQINQHPVTKLWASKLHDLARMGLSDTEAFGAAYDACRSLAGLE